MFAGGDVYGIGFQPERAGRRPIRLGLIGVGGVAQSKWLPAVRRLQTLWDPVEVVGIADPAEAQGRKVERLYGCRWYPDHSRLLADAMPQAVLISSPDGFHGRHARDPLSTGWRLWWRSRFAPPWSKRNRFCRLAQENGTVLMAVANPRFAPPFRHAHRLVQDLEEFRSAGLMVGKMHLGYDYVDLLEDATVHLFDLARFFMGEVITVEAHGLGRVEGRHPYPFRQAAITLEFLSGSIAQLSTSSSALSLKPWLRVEVHGDGSWLAVDDVFSSHSTTARPGRQSRGGQ